MGEIVIYSLRSKNTTNGSTPDNAQPQILRESRINTANGSASIYQRGNLNLWQIRAQSAAMVKFRVKPNLYAQSRPGSYHRILRREISPLTIR